MKTIFHIPPIPILSILLLLTFFTEIVFGEEEKKNNESTENAKTTTTTTIKILTKKLDVPEIINSEDWEVNYQSIMNEYFREMNASDDDLKGVELEFSFYDYGTVGNSSLGLQFDYLNDVAESLWGGDYDMVIIDDRTLFSEISYMESDWIEFFLYSRKPSVDLLVNLSKNDIEKDRSLEFNDPKAMKDARYRGALYGLPYELDFDLLYYATENPKSKKLAETMQDLTWDAFIEEVFPDPIKISLSEDHNMLNFFVEYAYTRYNLTEDYDPNYFHVFYNDTAESFYQSFYDLVSNYTEGDMLETLMLTQDEAMASFLHGDSLFFKGKASHHAMLQDISTQAYGMTLPPRHFSVVTEKFLVINQFSPIDPKVLVKAAGQLTSKAMQRLRAEKFGSIPTFDMSQRESDPDIESYCQSHETLCHYLGTMNRLYVKDLFTLKYSPPFYEIIVLLVPIIKTYLREYNLPKMIFSFKNINELITFGLGIYGVLAYVFTIAIALCTSFMAFLVYKYRKHPYLKVISPSFCIMIIIGCTLSSLKILQNLPPYSELRAKFDLIYTTVSTNLIYIPMFSVTYRIYRIHNTSTVLSRALTNKNLMIGTTVAIAISVIFRLCAMFTQEFYCLPFGSLRSPRFPEWMYTNRDQFNKYYETYLQIIVSWLVWYGWNIYKSIIILLNKHYPYIESFLFYLLSYNHNHILYR